MNKELPTQVDEACENTSDREIYKRFARHLEANEHCDICGKSFNFTNILQ